LIRDLSDDEKAALKAGACPFCRGSTLAFEARARGGLATNYYCPCGAGFNLAFFQGQYVAAELIAEHEKQPE
jgi:hypothetical protein